MSDSDIPTDSTTEKAPTSGVSDKRVVELLKGSQKLLNQHVRACIAKFISQWNHQLAHYAELSKNDVERRRILDDQRELQVNRTEFLRYFGGYLSECFVQFKRQNLYTETGEEYLNKDLSIISHDELEESVAISSIAHRAETSFASQLFLLAKRFSILQDDNPITHAGNPVSPVQFCVALRRAMTRLDLSINAKMLAYKAFDSIVVAELNELYREINAYLAGGDILPELYDTDESGRARILASPGMLPATKPMPSRIAGVVDDEVSSVVYQNKLMDAIRVLQSHVERYNNQRDYTGQAVYTEGQVVNAITALQQQMSSLTQQLDSGTALDIKASGAQGVINQLNDTLMDAEKNSGAINPHDLQIIDIVGLLFDYMLADDNLPDAIKTLLSHLHTPYLKLAFVDHDFFEQSEHPARLLLNSMAEAGSRWVSNDGSSQYDIYDKIKAIVTRILQGFQQDVRLFAELLLDFSQYTKQLSRRQELLERRATEKVQGEEKLREVKMQVNKEIRQRTDGKELPSAVLLFLLQPWSDYLAFILLRYNEGSEQWKQGLQIIDDTLWSIEPKVLAKDKTRQMAMHDDFMDALENGFQTIGYDKTKSKKLTDALLALQRMALQSKSVEPASAAMRDKLETLAQEKAGNAVMNIPITQEEQSILDNLRLIEFGTWFEFPDSQRLKLAWYNSNTSHYLFVDQDGKSVNTFTGIELARKMIASDARIIAGSTKPFFERALENIYKKLNITSPEKATEPSAPLATGASNDK